MTNDEIKQLTCCKHIKIYKLKQNGLKNSEIAKELGTNAGHVYNALKMYESKPELKDKSDSIA